VSVGTGNTGTRTRRLASEGSGGEPGSECG